MKRNPLRTSTGLGLFDIVIAGLSGAIGFEIFVLLNYAYFHLAGPDIVIALILGGAINFVIMLSYCELAAAMPKVGGEYTYLKTATEATSVSYPAASDGSQAYSEQP